MSTRYVAGWNVPGYSPESDEPPPVFDNYQSAVDYLADEMERVLDGITTSTEHADPSDDERWFDLPEAMQELTDYMSVRTPNVGGQHDLGTVWWVEEAEDERCERCGATTAAECCDHEGGQAWSEDQ